MKKLLVAVLVGLPLFGCTQESSTDTTKTPPPGTPAEGDPTEPTDTPAADGGGQDPQSTAPKTEDNCLDGQDMDAADVDVKACPAIPAIPNDVKVGKEKYSLGAWEMGTAANGATYVYGSLSAPTASPRTLTYEGGQVAVNDKNLECWGKGYYRLRKILQDPPAEYVALRKAGFQYRFFQFQTDLRNGPTGYRGISSFQDHLVKWVTVITAQGTCQQPTLSKFREYAKSELTRRGLPQPGGT